MSGPLPDLPVALTMGEPAGIGLDITLAAWRGRGAFSVPPFYLLADPDALRRRADLLGLAVPIEVTSPERAVSVFDDALPVVALSASASAGPGAPDKTSAPLVEEAIVRAVADVRERRAAAVATNPINKAVMMEGGFAFPGHTDFLGQLAAAWTGSPVKPVMMLAGPELRTVPVTVHIPLREVPERLSSELIVETGRILDHDLRQRFGLSRPRIAVTGLNPHAGEEGRLGREDGDVVKPAIEALCADGIDATGPHPADTLFHASARKSYDAALCMYHDQALIPAKTLAFDQAVNVTLGLPFIRTSPDHGTAFARAGTGTANPGSLVAALKLAAEMATVEASRR